MRIAITGSTGMIGSELAAEALDRGYEVVSVIRPGSDRIGNVPEGSEIVECDISDYHSLFGKGHCDLFFHFSWNKTFGAGRDDAYAQIDNIRYTVDAVNLAHDWGAKAFIGAGSQAEFGPVTVPLDCDTPVDPQSGYGIAKYTAGRLSKLTCDQLGMRFNWARILSVYGPLDAGHTLISYLIDSFKEGVVPELTKCEQMWDYIYSKDAASALLAIGEKGVNGRSYPIGSGRCRPLGDYVRDIRDMINPDLDIGFGKKEYYPHQPMFLCSDNTQLTEDTGFSPVYDFRDGIRETLAKRRH